MSDCIFCAISAGKAPASLVWRDAQSMAFMDVFPWAPGHVLVIPHRHAVHLHELDTELRSHLFEVANRVRQAMPAAGIPCDGAHFFVNDGKAANQSVPHVHVHVLPRRWGDGKKVLASFTARWAKLALGRAAARGELDQLAGPLRAELEKGRV